MQKLRYSQSSSIHPSNLLMLLSNFIYIIRVRAYESMTIQMCLAHDTMSTIVFLLLFMEDVFLIHDKQTSYNTIRIPYREHTAENYFDKLCKVLCNILCKCNTISNRQLMRNNILMISMWHVAPPDILYCVSRFHIRRTWAAKWLQKGGASKRESVLLILVFLLILLLILSYYMDNSDLTNCSLFSVCIY